MPPVGRGQDGDSESDDEDEGHPLMGNQGQRPPCGESSSTLVYIWKDSQPHIE